MINHHGRKNNVRETAVIDLRKGGVLYVAGKLARIYAFEALFPLQAHPIETRKQSRMTVHITKQKLFLVHRDDNNNVRVQCTYLYILCITSLNGATKCSIESFVTMTMCSLCLGRAGIVVRRDYSRNASKVYMNSMSEGRHSFLRLVFLGFSKFLWRFFQFSVCLFTMCWGTVLYKSELLRNVQSEGKGKHTIYTKCRTVFARNRHGNNYVQKRTTINTQQILHRIARKYKFQVTRNFRGTI